MNNQNENDNLDLPLELNEEALNFDDQDEEIEVAPFDPDLVRKYPRSNRKVNIQVQPYSLKDESVLPDGQSLHISPHGLEFKTTKEFEEGTLLKIEVSLPNYWQRKQKFVEYSRIDEPQNFKILAKVVKSESIGKRGKNKAVMAKTIVIDEVDEKVLKSFLQEG